jgi:N-methylhydantoinase B
VDGAREGSPNYVKVIRTDGSEEDYAFVSGLTVNAGDVIRVITANGGGLGDPKDRDPDLVRRDIRNGLISAERAAEIYGVGA